MITRSEAETLLQQRLAEDPELRQRLLEDPNATLREIFPEIPPGITVSVHQETLTDVHLVLPPAVDELSDEALQSAVGGFSDDCPYNF